MPRLGCELTEESMPRLKELIDKCIDDPSFSESRHQVKSEAWVYEGEGAKRAADWLMKKYEKIRTEEGRQNVVS